MIQRFLDPAVLAGISSLDLVAKTIQVGVTPVVISDEIQWVSTDEWTSQRQQFASQIDQWRRDWESRDTARYLSHYSKEFESDDQDYAGWAAHKRRVNGSKAWIKVGLSGLAMVRYPREKFVVVSFDQDYRSSNLHNQMRKRQYWAKEGTRWKILYEGGV